jgi:hypothetical protein
VLKEIQKPPVVESSPSTIKSKTGYMHFSSHALETPKTADNLAAMRRYIEPSLAGQGPLDARTKSSIQKVANAAENGLTDRALHLDQISLLFAQNNEKAIRTSVRSTVVGAARVTSYEDIVEAQQKRDIKEVKASIGRLNSYLWIVVTDYQFTKR